MKFLYFSLFTLLIGSTGMAQDLAAFRMFDAKGKLITYKKVQKNLTKAEIICFGESHNNPIAHWLELEFLDYLIEAKGSSQLVCGAEMFETNQQPALDSLWDGSLSAKEFEEQTTLWSNYDTDYRPLVMRCKAAGIPFVATNCPTPLARQTARQGIQSLEALPDSQKQWLAPLPIEIDYDLPSYAAMKKMIGNHGGGMKAENFIAAQAIKDATMAHNILHNHQVGQTFYHLNGSYHTQNREGIIWYLQQAQPELPIYTIGIVEQDQLDALEADNLGFADLIIAVPNNMTKTYLTGFE